MSGYINLKRKDLWVKRYATVDIDEHSFSYKSSASDSKIRHTIFLTDAKIKRAKSEYIIYIEKGTNDVKSSTDGAAVRVSFTKNHQLEEWLKFLMNA